MEFVPRVTLTPVPQRVRDARDTHGAKGGPRTSLVSLASRAWGRMTPDAGAALAALDEAVTAAGGDLRINDCWRDPATQAALRGRYENWLRAGSPPRTSSRFDVATMRTDAASRPGRSFHGAGRAVDIVVSALRFPGVPASGQLDKFWTIARTIGWRPIIKEPEETASEAWHFDYMGPWAGLHRLHGYEAAAMAANLDVGALEVFGASGPARYLQAQLHRAGHDCGDLDGAVGPRTLGALKAAGWTGTLPTNGGAPPNEVLCWVAALTDAAR